MHFRSNHRILCSKLRVFTFLQILVRKGALNELTCWVHLVFAISRAMKNYNIPPRNFWSLEEKGRLKKQRLMNRFKIFVEVLISMILLISRHETHLWNDSFCEKNPMIFSKFSLKSMCLVQRKKVIVRKTLIAKNR